MLAKLVERGKLPLWLPYLRGAGTALAVTEGFRKALERLAPPSGGSCLATGQTERGKVCLRPSLLLEEKVPPKGADEVFA